MDEFIVNDDDDDSSVSSSSNGYTESSTSSHSSIKTGNRDQNEVDAQLEKSDGDDDASTIVNSSDKGDKSSSRSSSSSDRNTHAASPKPSCSYGKPARSQKPTNYIQIVCKAFYFFLDIFKFTESLPITYQIGRKNLSHIFKTGGSLIYKCSTEPGVTNCTSHTL